MNYNSKTGLLFFTAIGMIGIIFPVMAFSSPLTFDGTNPGLFNTAPPNGLPALMNSVVKPTNPATTLQSATSATDLIQRGILSQISTKINNQIFDTSNPSGSYDLGGGNQVSFVRTGGNIVITLVDTKTGTTVITMPDL